MSKSKSTKRPTKTNRSATAKTVTAAPAKIDKASKIHIVKPGARKAGTKGGDSFAIYKNGMTIEEYLSFEGSGMSHLRFDLDRGYVKLT